jgi:2,3-bisphosphoglycerate-independent phosphoglycerate mutase
MSDPKGVVKYDIVKKDTVELDIEHIISRFIGIIDKELSNCYIYSNSPELDTYDSGDYLEVKINGLDDVVDASDIEWKRMFLEDINELAEMTLDIKEPEELQKSSE